MLSEARRDLLWILVEFEGVVTLVCAWILLLLAVYRVNLDRFAAPGLAFATSAMVLLLTYAVVRRIGQGAGPPRRAAPQRADVRPTIRSR
jgi:hypothetical protein